MKRNVIKARMEEQGFDFSERDGIIAITRKSDGKTLASSIGPLVQGNLDEFGSENMQRLADYIATPEKERISVNKFRVKVLPEMPSAIGKYLTKYGDISGWAGADTVFIGVEYILFKRDHPEWAPFLPVYDINNTAIFIPVKDGDVE